MPPVNDNFADAILIVGESGTVAVDNTDATAEVGEPLDPCETDLLQSVWLKYVVPTDGRYVFDTLLSEPSTWSFAPYIDTTLQAFTGGPDIPSLVYLADNDDTNFDFLYNRSKLPIDLTTGTTVYFQIAGCGDGSYGPMIFRWRKIPLNSGRVKFFDANSLGPSSYVGRWELSVEPFDPVVGSDGNMNEFTFEIPLPGGGFLGFYLGCYAGIPSDPFTNGFLFDSENPPFWADFFSNFKVPPGDWGADSEVNANQWDGLWHSYDLGWPVEIDEFSDPDWSESAPPPANDNIADAVPLIGLSGSEDWDSSTSTLEPGEPNHNWHIGGPSGEVGATYTDLGSIWFTWTCPSDPTCLYVLVDNEVALMAAYEDVNVYGKGVRGLRKVSNRHNYIIDGESKIVSMVNGSPGKRYYIAIAPYTYNQTSGVMDWQTEAIPEYHFDGPGNILLLGDEGFEGGYTAPWTDWFPYREAIYYTSLRQVDRRPYGIEVGTDTDPEDTYETIFEGADYFWRGCVVDSVLIVPWIVQYDDGPLRMELWRYEDGLANPPNRAFAHDALVTAGIWDGETPRTIPPFWQPEIEQVVYAGGYLWCFFGNGWLKLNLDGTFVEKVVLWDRAVTNAGPQLGYRAFISSDGSKIYCYNYTGSSPTSRVAIVDTSTHTVTITNLQDAGHYLFVRADGTLVRFDTSNVRVYAVGWDTAATPTPVHDWAISFPDPAYFDEWAYGASLNPDDDNKIRYTRFVEIYPGHQRNGTFPHDSNILGGNWITCQLWEMNISTGTSEIVGWWEPYPRWNSLQDGPTWFIGNFTVPLPRS